MLALLGSGLKGRGCREIIGTSLCLWMTGSMRLPRRIRFMRTYPARCIIKGDYRLTPGGACACGLTTVEYKKHKTLHPIKREVEFNRS